MKERRPSGEPVLAEVGPPVILSLGVAGYLSVIRALRSASLFDVARPSCRWLFGTGIRGVAADRAPLLAARGGPHESAACA
jgi:hypothetical protein